MRYKLYYKNKSYKLIKSGMFFIPAIYRATTIAVSIKLPDGSPLANKQVYVNDVQYTTDSSGIIAFTGDRYSNDWYFVKYSENYYTKTQINILPGTVCECTLDAHVVAGSVTVSAWKGNYNDVDRFPYNFTVPECVNVIRITGDAFDGYQDEYTDYAYVGTSAYKDNQGVIYLGDDSFTKYVAVTPGKQYTIYGRWVNNAIIAWSDEINSHSPDVTI